jgi:lipopolysaccharide/colanic/teichoic acid biosynthesis glycosyltransferase
MSVVREVENPDPLDQPRHERDCTGPGALYEPMKRVLDLCVAGATLLALAPLLALAAAAIKLTSPGPVFYRGTVIGRWGRAFTYYKLRTMIVGGDDSAHRDFIASYVMGAVTDSRDRDATEKVGQADSLPHADRQADSLCHSDNRGAVGGEEVRYKLVNDPRITPVGRLLRKTSLDEVAQMFNVIRGEMSIVGPRPPVPYEYRLYDDRHKQRLAVLPGITGLAQVRARGRASFQEMVAIDLEYIRRRSIGGDLAIMARTIWVVLAGRGAH